MLRRLGADRNVVVREVAADRWRLHGSQTVAVHQLPLNDVALRWRAIWEVGPQAVVDGISALAAGGVSGFDEHVVHVSVPRSVHRPRVPGVRIHRVQRVSSEVAAAGIPRTRPAIAAVRAASWAVSDRQAALLLTLPVQQRVITGAHLLTADADLAVRRRGRLISQVVRDIDDGAQSLGELDFGALCRRRGLPAPDRQVVRRTPTGRIYLDVGWSEVGLVVEIDGAGHRVGLAVTDDNLRQNTVMMMGDVVLRIDLVGLRVRADAFLDQVCDAYVILASRGGVQRVPLMVPAAREDERG